MTKNNDSENNLSFWKYNKEISILALFSMGIPIFLIIMNLVPKFDIGLNIGNSIALLAAGIAIASTLYSNYRNDIRNKKQIESAESRLGDQLKHAENQLKMQLIFNEQQKVMLKLYDILHKTQRAISIDFEKINPNSREYKDKLNVVISERTHLFRELKSIQENIYCFYYLPSEIQEKIDNFVKYVNDLSEPDEKNLEIYSPITNPSMGMHIIEIYDLVEKNLGIKISRDYHTIPNPLNIFVIS